MEPLLWGHTFYTIKMAFQEGVSNQGKKSIHLCLDLHCQVAFLEGVASHQGGLSEGVPLSVHMYTLVRRSHDRFKNRDNGPGPWTEIRRPVLRTRTRSHEQSGIPVLSIGASMSGFTDRWRASLRWLWSLEKLIENARPVKCVFQIRTEI